MRRAQGLVVVTALVLAGASVVLAETPGGLVVTPPLASNDGYLPGEATIRAGTQLQYANLDLQAHDVASVARDGQNKRLFASSLIGFGQRAPVAGTERLAPGSYPFVCSVHGDMKGILTVLGELRVASTGLSFTAPSAWEPIGLGEQIAYALEGACERVQVVAVVRAGADELGGTTADGCAGVVVVPSEQQLTAGGLDPAEVTGIILRATVDGEVAAEVPLRPKRLEVEYAEQLTGTFAVTETDDPFGGGRALDVSGPGGVISLGVIDLTEISSISVRAQAPSGVCHPSYEGTYCRVGSVIFTSGAPSGPLIGVADIRGTDEQRPWMRTVSEPVRIHPDGPVEVFATFAPLRATTEVFARVNYIELNGSGAALPHAFGADPEGTVTLFDGTSLDGWTMAGTGWFELDADRSMRTVGGYGLLWYQERTFDDFTLRLEFKADSPDANSGVFVRFDDPAGSALAPSDTGYEIQIQDYGQAYIGSSDRSQTGAIYSVAPADRINTRTIGGWNTLEITVIGQQYTVGLNGRVINVFDGARRTDGYIGVQNHDPTGTVWFRDIRVIPT